MTDPDEFPVDSDDEEAGLDPAEVTAAREDEADEADLIEQAYGRSPRGRRARL